MKIDFVFVLKAAVFMLLTVLWAILALAAALLLALPIRLLALGLAKVADELMFVSKAIELLTYWSGHKIAEQKPERGRTFLLRW